MKNLHMVAFILLVIGGLNWLLVGLGVWNVGELFGPEAAVTKAIYVLVGLSAIVELATHKKNCKRCNAQPGM